MYHEREPSLTYDDAIISDCQPDVYALAGFIAHTAGYRTITDVGCGRGSKLLQLKQRYGFHLIGLDTETHTDYCRGVSPEDSWLAHDLEEELPPVHDDVVICADVLEHLKDPTAVLRFVRGARVAVLSTPERDAFYGPGHQGPPKNIHHVREWCMEEFRALLQQHGVQIQFLGMTRSHVAPYTLDIMKNIIVVCGKKEGL